MKKADAIRYITAKIEDDEEVFIIRAADKCAAPAVFNWAFLANLAGSPAAKVQGAHECAKRMANYHSKKTPD